MKLDNNLRQEYLDKHLPYRINSMLSPDLITHRRKQGISAEMRVKCYEDSLVLEPSFEISIIFGRSLLNFLGITLDFRTNDLRHYRSKEDDLTIRDIYPNGNHNTLQDQIVLDNKDKLCTIMKLANKSVAHLTSSMSNEEEHSQLASARLTIYRLMLKYVPEINKSAIWWHQQVEKQ